MKGQKGRSIQCDHIPVFESNVAAPDTPNNPWKGKHPKKQARISVAMPPDDWLCQKLERLNTTVAEGYPSRAQDSAGLKREQFVKIPKSQSRWYQMHTIKLEGPHRPGKNLFSWSNTEVKVNSQFPRIIKTSSYSPAGPPSRPISQDYLCHWERCAREGSYIVNSAAGFNQCSSELQEGISNNVAFLSAKINKGKAPKEVTEALKDIKDYMAFHQNVSVVMGTALQHLADSLFVNLTNLVLIRRDSYLEHVKQGMKPDTWNLLRNAPVFVYGLFPDSVLCTAEQDITKFESAGVAPVPGPGASHTPTGEGILGTARMKGETPTEVQVELIKPNSHGANFLEIETGAVDVVEVQSSNPRFSKLRGLKTYK